MKTFVITQGSGPMYQCGEHSLLTVWLTHPWWWRQYAPLKRRSTIILHGRISQKTTLNIILAAVRTWNLTFLH
jgi:hypothetical protein